LCHDPPSATAQPEPIVAIMHPSLDYLAHRPWPLPSARWRWCQSWHDLVFLHWPVSASALLPHLSRPLRLDLYDGKAWLGLVPFRMSGVTFRGVPPVPWLSAFAEMNLRTYVTLEGRPGVLFLRMDASRALAVWAARRTLSLPYVWSSMRVRQEQNRIHYRVRHREAVFDATYAPNGPSGHARSGTLEAFLTERYCLYTRHRDRLLRVDIHHAPWPLQPVDVELRANTVPESRGCRVQGAPPLAHFSAAQDVIGWSAVDAIGASGIDNRRSSIENRDIGNRGIE
jgi:uncharacterized protein YqjF (DUF2071 family)